jgi:signal transduction histidine kinase
MTALARLGRAERTAVPTAPPHGGRWRSGAFVLVGMAVFVATVYAVVVLGGSLLLGRLDPSSPILSIVATAVVALTFESVRGRFGRLASRLLDGSRSAPYDVLRGFTATVGGSLPVEDVPSTMASVLTRSLDAEWAQVWLAVRGRFVLAATWPPEAAPVAPAPHLGEPGAPSAPANSRDGNLQTLEVRHAGELLGLIRVRPRQWMTAFESRLAADLAAQAGLVLHGLRLRSELLERVEELTARAEELRASRQRLVAAQDEERRRLERDLHDGAQQHLVALAVNVRLAETVARAAPERAVGLLSAQAAAAEDAVDAVLSFSRGVYPPSLTHQGLPAALHEVATRSAVPVRLSTRDVGRYAPRIEAAVYFACMEALQNAVKHSGAPEVLVSLVGRPGELAMTVEDCGKGFDARALVAGSGLSNLRDRVDAVGGVLVFDASPQRGVRVHAAVPVPGDPTNAAGGRS